MQREQVKWVNAQHKWRAFHRWYFKFKMCKHRASSILFFLFSRSLIFFFSRHLLSIDVYRPWQIIQLHFIRINRMTFFDVVFFLGCFVQFLRQFLNRERRSKSNYLYFVISIKRILCSCARFTKQIYAVKRRSNAVVHVNFSLLFLLLIFVQFIRFDLILLFFFFWIYLCILSYFFMSRDCYFPFCLSIWISLDYFVSLLVSPFDCCSHKMTNEWIRLFPVNKNKSEKKFNSHTCGRQPW